MQECPARFCGWGDKESWEDSSRNIERPRKSAKISIIISTWLLRVINSKINLSWLNPSTKWNQRNWEKPNSLKRRKQDKKRPKKEKKRETTVRWLPWVSFRMMHRRRKRRQNELAPRSSPIPSDLQVKAVVIYFLWDRPKFNTKHLKFQFCMINHCRKIDLIAEVEFF